MSDSLISVEEVAARLGVKPSTVRAGVARGAIPAVVLWKGRKRSLMRFDPDAIERLIEERTISGQRRTDSQGETNGR